MNLPKMQLLLSLKKVSKQEIIGYGFLTPYKVFWMSDLGTEKPKENNWGSLRNE